MKLVFELDPLRCKHCGENMKIIAFIQNPREIEKIAGHLGYPTWRAPPPFAPGSSACAYNSEYSQLQR